ncbi:porin family protein [Alkalimonas mucilaginosa]|uniref:Porin family protein n=1 Tax=Alkalimonas mucilaginosa TaxID=3057676 RepID=A0ABU7JGQ9_9GAMM|nr:porin family protein [Alkalimonas sp. MEB004]MEE2024340.1 porin family protein [Alkalimonas sp. MEB004]
MKKLALMAGAVALLAGQAVANEGFYAGAQYERHNLKANEEEGSVSYNLGTIGLLGGYQITENFAIEGRWHFGVQDKSKNFDDGRTEVKLRNRFALLGKGMVPLTDEFSLYGLAGYSHAKYRLDWSDEQDSVRVSPSGKGFTWGVGGAYAINNQFAVHLEYNDLPKAKIEDAKARASAISLGFSYKF